MSSDITGADFSAEIDKRINLLLPPACRLNLDHIRLHVRGARMQGDRLCPRHDEAECDVYSTTVAVIFAGLRSRSRDDASIVGV